MSFFDFLDDRIQEHLNVDIRPGFYVGVVSNALQSFRRVAIDANWGPTLEQARRVSSPLLDVIPAVDTRMAVISQDGVPEFPAVFGKVWDDEGLAADMTAWLRSNLQEHPGHVELGAEDGIRIRLGSNTAEIDETGGDLVVESEDGNTEMRMKSGGDVVVEATSGVQASRMTLKSGGDVVVEGGQVDIEGAPVNLSGGSKLLARAQAVLSELEEIAPLLNEFVTKYNDAVERSSKDNGNTKNLNISSNNDEKLSEYSADKPGTSSVYGD